MIHIDDITKRYGTTTVVDRVTLEVPPGGVIALIGANGAGKSTLLSIVGRLLEPDGGRVTIDGLDVQATPGPTLARRLSVLRQENHLPVRLTVRELVEFGRFPHAGGRLRAEDRDHVRQAIAYLALDELADRHLDQLSGGQRQRAYIAMVLAQDTDYVLLDEPLNNLDMRHAAQSMHLIRSLADEFGKTVVVVLHDVNVAAHHSDRIIAMKAGRVVADGAPGEIVTPSVLRAVFDLDVPVAEVDGAPVALHFGRAPAIAAGTEPGNALSDTISEEPPHDRPIDDIHLERRAIEPSPARAGAAPAAAADAARHGGVPAGTPPGPDLPGRRRARRLLQRWPS